MKPTCYAKLSATVLSLVCGLCVLSADATYVNINVDGDFSDWSTVPVAATAPSNPSIPNDLASIKLANNDNFLFILLTFYSPVNPNSTPGGGTYLALDNDNNTATGFDIFGLGLVGSEAGWQNDFPFEQSSALFNTGNGITGGAGLISPYFTVTTTQEYAIARSATFTVGGGSLFPSDTFTLLAYSVDNGGKYLGPAQYTFSEAVPEPSTAMLFLCGGIVLHQSFKQRRTRGRRAR